MRIAFLSVVLGLLLTSCAGPLPATTSTPPNTSAPSLTPPPAATTTPTLEPTSAAPSVTPTFDLSAPGALSCRVRSQSVRNNTKFDPKERFDMAWQVKNTGDAAWDPESVRFAYYSGSRLQVSDVNQLRETVNHGDMTSLVTDMIAPRSSGAYTTFWSLWYGDNDFCHMSLTIVVR